MKTLGLLLCFLASGAGQLLLDCSNSKPLRGVEKSTSEEAFQIFVSQDYIITSQPLQVELTVKPGTEFSFVGYYIKPIPVGNTSGKVRGEYKDVEPPGQIQCDEGITNTTTYRTRSLTFQWLPLSQGRFEFEAIVFDSQTTYFRNIRSKVIKVVKPSPHRAPVSRYETKSGSTIMPDPLCDTSKGCFRDCNATACRFQLKWQRVGDYFEFDIAELVDSDDADSRWLAMGVSYDMQMHNTSTVMCMVYNGTGTIRIGITYFYTFQFLPNETDNLVANNVSMKDSIISCGFKRSIKSFNTTIFFPLTSSYYLMVGQGDIIKDYNGTEVPAGHDNDPDVSPNPVAFQPKITQDPSCEVTKGCFSDCNKVTGCSCQVTWQPVGEYVEFEVTKMVSSSDGIWVAIGFSLDQNMPDTSVVMCATANDVHSVRVGYNYNHQFAFEDNPDVVENGSLTIADSVFRCSFRRKIIVFDKAENIFQLNKTYHLLVAQGPASYVRDILLPMKHQENPIASVNKFDFVHMNHTGPITTEPTIHTTEPANETTTVSQETTAPTNETTAPTNETTTPSYETTAPANETTTPVNETTVVPITDTTHHINDTTLNPRSTIVPDPGCGVTKGCFSDCNTTDCRFQVTWKPEGDNVEFEMESYVPAGDGKWMAIGFSYDQQMSNTSVVMCVVSNGTGAVGFGFNNGYTFNYIVNRTTGLSSASASLSDSILRCNFRRIVGDNTTYLIYPLIRTYYLLAANGETMVDDSSGAIIPQQHTNTPDISPEMQNFQQVNNSDSHTTPSSVETTVNPSGVIAEDPECGIHKGCFSKCNGADCVFQVTWRPENDSVSFEMAQVLTEDEGQWMAIGFSENKMMPNTSVVMCMVSGANATLGLGFNRGFQFGFIQNRTEGLQDVNVSLTDSVIRCAFRRSIKVEYDASEVFPLTEEYDLFVASGKTSVKQGVVTPSPHTTMPFISEDIFDFRSVNKSEVITTPAAPSTEPPSGSTQPMPSGTITKDPECSKSKGCFYKCSGSTCDFEVTWQKNQDNVRFELAAVVTAGQDNWMAIGFSDDDKMGNDSVVGCVYNNDKVTVEMGYNTQDPTYKPLTDRTVGLSQTSGSLEGNVMRCQFDRLITVPKNAEVFDLKVSWYLLFAHGKAVSGFFQKHKDKPIVSSDKADMMDTKEMSGNTKSYPLVKLHASLMIIAWMFCSSLGTTLARFFKPVWGETKIFGVKVWFQAHRSLMIAATVLTLIAFIVIFVEAGGYAKMTGTFGRGHPVMGIIVFVLCMLNPIMAMFRCSPDSENRYLFNYFHWGAGTIAHILGGLSIFFGIFLDKANVSSSARIVMATYTVVSLAAFFIHTIHSYRTKQVSEDKAQLRAHADEDDENSIQGVEDNEKVPDTVPDTYEHDKFKKILLGIQVVCLGILSITQIIFVNVGK